MEDGSNESSQFLRNRIRHQMMPLFRQENPRIAEKTVPDGPASAAGFRFPRIAGSGGELPSVTRLREMPQALRSRVLERYLKSCGVKEPEDVHLEQMEGLIAFTESFCLGNFPGGVTIERRMMPDGKKGRRFLVGNHVTLSGNGGDSRLPGDLRTGGGDPQRHGHFYRHSTGNRSHLLPSGRGCPAPPWRKQILEEALY